MNTHSNAPAWTTIAILVGRLIFAALFIMAASFKFMDIGGTTGYIASAGFPMSQLLAWLAAFFETALAIGLLTGAYFTEAALLAAVYVIFLAFAFHGPSHWEGNQAEFGFIDHLPSWPACCSAACMAQAASWRPPRLLHRGCN
jgi:uncharacterized membrane protein YphA (DoxX/SURF4 family)